MSHSNHSHPPQDGHRGTDNGNCDRRLGNDISHPLKAASLETTFQDRKTGILSSSTDPITHWVAQSST